MRTDENKKNQTSALVWYNLLLQDLPPGITADCNEAVIPHSLMTEVFILHNSFPPGITAESREAVIPPAPPLHTPTPHPNSNFLIPLKL